ncbi:SDR family oxidoreductase [bacterium]|nr:SDR family oxidoreductase [bacterium]
MNILITGGSRGIGFDVVKKLSSMNHSITVISRTEGFLSTLENSNIEWIETDLSKVEEYEKLTEKLKNRYFDVFISNAGGGAHSKIQHITQKKINEAINLNLNAPIFITSIVSKEMIQRKSGIIIFISSIHGLKGNPNSSLYSSSKFAIRGFAESLYEELKKHFIKITTIYPDYVNTSLLPSGVSDRDKMLSSEDVADVICKVIDLPKGVVIKDLTLSSLYYS